MMTPPHKPSPILKVLVLVLLFLLVYKYMRLYDFKKYNNEKFLFIQICHLLLIVIYSLYAAVLMPIIPILASLRLIFFCFLS